MERLTSFHADESRSVPELFRSEPLEVGVEISRSEDVVAKFRYILSVSIQHREEQIDHSPTATEFWSPETGVKSKL